MENTKSCRVNRPDPYRDQALFTHAYKGLRWFYIIFWPGGLLTFYDPFFLITVSQPENFSPEMIFLKPGATLRRHQIKLHSYRANVQWAIIKKRIY